MNFDYLFRKFFRNPTSPYHKYFLFIGANQNGEFSFQTSLAKEFNVPNTSLNYYITKFYLWGLLKPKTLFLTDKGKRFFTYLWKNIEPPRLRGHHLQIKFNILKCPDNFVKKYNSSVFSLMGNGKYSGLKGVLGDVTFMFYSKRTIVCVLQNVYADNVETLSSSIQLIVSDLKERLERQFEGIKISSGNVATIRLNHIAFLKSYLAKVLRQGGFTFQDGKIILDYSKKEDELEFTENDSNLEDMEVFLAVLEGVFKYLSNN